MPGGALLLLGRLEASRHYLSMQVQCHVFLYVCVGGAQSHVLLRVLLLVCCYRSTLVHVGSMLLICC